MSAPLLDLAGQVFGRLTVLERAEPGRDGAVRWRCLCDCGNESIARSKHLRSGATASCGCGRRTHGLYGTSTYWTWLSMVARCHRPGSKSYPRYGGAGVTVCPEWRESFAAFVADMGERLPGTTLDRIDNEQGYSRSNCRWATPDVQAANRRGSLKRCDSAHPFKGVERRGKVWRARIRDGGTSRSIGHYTTAEEAARAYDAQARRIFGDRAAVNFPAAGERAAVSDGRLAGTSDRLTAEAGRARP